MTRSCTRASITRKHFGIGGNVSMSVSPNSTWNNMIPGSGACGISTWPDRKPPSTIWDIASPKSSLKTALARPIDQGLSGACHLLGRFGKREPNIVMPPVWIEITPEAIATPVSFRIRRQNDKLSFVSSTTSAYM